MKIYFDQNVWQHLCQNYPVNNFKKDISSKNIEIYFSTGNIYEFGRLFLNKRNKEMIKKLFTYLWELAEISKFIKELKYLVLDDLEYARSGGKTLPFLSDINTASAKQEIYKISQGNYEEGKKFIKERENDIKKDVPDFINKVKTVNPPVRKNIKYEDFRENWDMRRKILNLSQYRNNARNLSDALLFDQPQKYPFINTLINAQLYISFAVLAWKAKPNTYTSDFRHLICANSAGNFVTMDQKLISIGQKVCPYIQILGWEDFDKIING